MVYLQDPSCYVVKLDRVNTKTLSSLLALLGDMDDGILIVKNLVCKIYYLRNLNINISDMLVGQTLSEVNTEYIVSSYRRQREVVISKVSSQIRLISDEYRLALLLSAINSYVKNAQNECVCQLHLTSEGTWTGHMTNDETWTDPITLYRIWTGPITSDGSWMDPMIPHESSHDHMRTHSSRTHHLPERVSHHTKPEYPSPDETVRPDNTDTILGKKFNPNLDCIYPSTGPSEYNNPLIRSSWRYEDNVKYSVEVTDPSLDGCQASIAPSMSSVARPLNGLLSSNTELVTNVSGFRRERGTSYQSDEHAATGYDDTFSRHVNSESSIPVYSIQRQSHDQRNNVKHPRHPQYGSLGARLQSYTTYGWNEVTKPLAGTLADSGFFATGNGDLVRCFQCGLGLKDWMKDDDPLTEHVKHATECDFLVETLGVIRLRRMKDALSTAPSSGINANSQAELTRTAPNTSLPYPVRNPRYITMEDRIASFICFPRHITQTPRDLALAGLFFTGEDDICRCFTCDGGLKNWVPGDDPIEEHAKYFPQCPYLRQLKGDNFVQLVQRRMQSPSETVNSPAPRPTSQPPVAPVAVPLNEHLFRGAREANAGLQSAAARSVLEMGYSEDVVRRAMTQLQNRGEATPTAQQLMELILNYEDNGELPTVPGSGTEYNARVAQTGDLDLMSENERLKAIMKCVICHTAERNVLCIPCSHLRMCTDCAKHVTNCPECGRHIETKIKTFMS